MPLFSKKSDDSKHSMSQFKKKVLPIKPEEKAEGQIESALRRGEFNNLPGAGKPLQLDSNPFTKDTALATDLLKKNGFSSPVLQEKREIETAVSKAEKKLLLIWQLYDGTEKSRAKWQAAKETFSEEITKINKRILTFNLKAPSVQLHIPSVRVNERIEAVQKSI